MAVVKPFPAIRPQAVKAAQIALFPMMSLPGKKQSKRLRNIPCLFCGWIVRKQIFRKGPICTVLRYMRKLESFSGGWWTREICARIWSLVITFMSSVWENMCRTGVAACASVGRLSGSCDQVP